MVTPVAAAAALAGRSQGTGSAHQVPEYARDQPILKMPLRPMLKIFKIYYINGIWSCPPDPYYINNIVNFEIDRHINI